MNENELLAEMYIKIITDKQRMVIFATLGRLLSENGDFSSDFSSDFSTNFIIESARILMEQEGVK